MVVLCGAINWLLSIGLFFNWLQNRNSILADEMGLGKTLQAAAFISELHRRCAAATTTRTANMDDSSEEETAAPGLGGAVLPCCGSFVNFGALASRNNGLDKSERHCVPW